MKSTSSFLLPDSLLTLGSPLRNSFLYSLQHRLKNQDWIPEPKTQQQEKEKIVRREEKIEKKVPESARDREEKRPQLSYEVQ